MTEVKLDSLTRAIALGSEHIVGQVFWIISFAFFTALGAQVEIPHSPVPYTLQTFVVLLTGALLGRRSAFLSMFVYLAAGAAGMPVFSGAASGLARLLGPTGGYLLSFPIAAFVISSLISLQPRSVQNIRGRIRRFFAVYGWGLGAMSAGLVLIFLFGTFQLNLVYYHNWSAAFGSGFLIFSWWDLLKLLVATSVWKELNRV